MKKHTIILDIDGTLLTSDAILDPITKDYLIDIQKQGHTLILASGRPTIGVIHFAKSLEMDKYNGYIVSFNGACAHNISTNELIYEKVIDIETSKAILNHLEDYDVIPMITFDDVMYVNDKDDKSVMLPNSELSIIEYESKGIGFDVRNTEKLADVVDKPLYKILVAGNNEYLNQHYKDLSEPFIESTNSVFSAPFYYEFTNKGIDKAKALQEIFIKCNLDRNNTIAIGDGHNDMSLLNYANIKIAMGNAVEELKEIADFVTTDNDNYGVVEGIKKALEN